MQLRCINKNVFFLGSLGQHPNKICIYIRHTFLMYHRYILLGRCPKDPKKNIFLLM